MDKLFYNVLELSWQAGLIALAVMAVRLVLRRRVSRRAVCWLWTLVALRLLLPLSLTAESPVSLQAEESPVSRAFYAMEAAPDAEKGTAPATPAPGAAQPVEEKPGAAEPAATLWPAVRLLPWVWVIGMGCMAAYMLLSFAWMWLKLLRAEHIEGNAYRCTEWNTPFVLGVLVPCIYVPETVSEQDLPQVLAHERCHIRRWDHVVKPLAFLLLAVNWFNPVLWLSYILLGRDMESACDETVLKNATPAQRAAYSRALVACAAQPKLAAVCPLAFGEVAVKERVKNVLQNRKQAVWAVILLAAAAVIIAVCLLTKPAERDAGAPDAETLYALRTEYIGDNGAVSGILDALGFREAGASGDGEPVDYSFEIGTENDAYGVVVRYAFTGALPQRSAEWNREMAQRGYLALALIDNAEWLRWEDVGAEGETPVSGTVYAGDYVAADYNAVRESAAGLQTLMDTLQARLEDGSIGYYPGDALPDFREITSWPTLGEDGVVSAKAEDYGIVYDAAALPDWETVPLSYLCAYYLNGDGAYSEGAMDTLARRYVQEPHTVRNYWERLRAVDAEAAARLEKEVTAWCAAMGDVSSTDSDEYAAEPYTVAYEGTDLKLRITGVYAQTSVTVRHAGNISEEQPVYTLGSDAQLTVVKGEGFTLYGRYTSEKRLLHDGEVIDLAQAYTGIGMDGQYNVQFRYIDRTEAARQGTLTFNDNGAGLVSYPAAWYSGSGYSICILNEGWHRLTPMDGWNDATVDGSLVLNGKPVEVWESTEDITARLYVAHLDAMTLKEAQDWAVDAAGSDFTLIESKQGDMFGTDGTGNQYWTAAFRGSDTERFAVIRTTPMSQWEHLGYALSAMADTFTVQ